MTPKLIMAAATAALAAITASAQTGILPKDAAFRNIPEQALQIERTLSPNKLETMRAEMKAYHEFAISSQESIVKRMKHTPVESDDLAISPVLDSLNRFRTERPISGSHRKGDNPVIFLIGDSTMRTEIEGCGYNGQWGWGYFLENYFNADMITVENHGLGGESTRSYYRTLFDAMLKGVRPGDWVIVQMGHNDQRPDGPELNGGRFRGILPGTGKEYKDVINPGTGTRERVYTYGEYLRRYIDEIRARGANPMLLSTTARKSMDENGKMRRDSHTAVIEAIAKEKGAAFIDLNSAICDRYDTFDPRKVEYLYFSDGIHTSSFGAVINAEVFVDQLRSHPEIGLGRYLLPERQHGNVIRKGNKPVTFSAGDASGKSIRTFLDEGLWNDIYEELQPGDIVTIQFGRYESGPINRGSALGSVPGNGDEKQVMTMEANGINQGIYSYGWYVRKYCLDAIERGAIPVVVGTGTEYDKWAREAALQVGAKYAARTSEIKKAIKKQ